MRFWCQEMTGRSKYKSALIEAASKCSFHPNLPHHDGAIGYRHVDLYNEQVVKPSNNNGV